MEPRIRFARTSDGVDIAYVVAGRGPPLLVARAVLQPAVDDEIAEFGPDIEQGHALRGWLRLAETRSLILWDYRGFGLSSAATPEYKIESSLCDMEAVADSLSLAQFDVLAFLTPCHTALAFAARHAERVRRLVLWNPARGGSSPRNSSFADVPELLLQDHFREYVELAALRVTGWERGPVAQRLAQRLMAQFTPQTWLGMMESMEAVDATNAARSLIMPTLVILDMNATPQLVTTDAQHFMRGLAAMLPHGELAVVRSGHSGRLATVIDKFLAGDQEAVEIATPSGTAVILFADIVDSTALTERLGDAAFRERARELDEALRGAIRSNGGAAIEGKVLGDGVLATFGAAREAIACASACHAAADACGLKLHVGVHAGDVIREDNNVYGGAVNVASRVAGEAAPGETLVSDVVRGLAKTSAGASFDDRGEHALKGVEEPVRLYEVRWREEA